MDHLAKCLNHTLTIKKSANPPIGGAGSYAGRYKTFSSGARVIIFFISCGDIMIDKKGRDAIISQLDILKKIIRDNIIFIITDDYNESDCRIGFDENQGNWSYVGYDCTDVKGKTMNIEPSSLDNPGIVLHELCHMIGLEHEHQNPDGCIAWDTKEVIKYYSGPPNNWSIDHILENVINPKSDNDIWAGPGGYDPKSIMHYIFDDKFIDEIQTKANYRKKYPNLTQDEINEKYLDLFRFRDTLSDNDISSIQKFYDVQTILLIRFYPGTDDDTVLMKCFFQEILEDPKNFLESAFFRWVPEKTEILETDIETFSLTIKKTPNTSLWSKETWEKIFYLYGARINIDKIEIKNMYYDERLHL